MSLILCIHVYFDLLFLFVFSVIIIKRKENIFGHFFFNPLLEINHSAIYILGGVTLLEEFPIFCTFKSRIQKSTYGTLHIYILLAFGNRYDVMPCPYHKHRISLLGSPQNAIVSPRNNLFYVAI